MVIAIIILLIILIAAAVILCGYTSIRIPVKKKEGVKRIACVGDNITYGRSVLGCFFRAYPNVLQKLRGESCQVGNFGVPGATLQTTGEKPYTNTKAFAESIAFDPDIVLIMLGSNDAKEKSWRSEEHFAKQYVEFMERYSTLERAPRIIICVPPYVTKPRNFLFSFTNKVDPDKMLQVVRSIKEVVVEQDAYAIDFNGITKGSKQFFSLDGLNVTGNGANIIAGVINKLM